MSPGERPRSPESKKLKKEESDGEKSDQDLVVDDSNEAPATNGNKSPRENGTDGSNSKKDPLSPSSARSTPASTSGGGGGGDRKKDDKQSTSPGAAKITPPAGKGLGTLGYPFPDGLPPPGVFNGFRPPLPGSLDPSRPLPPGLIGGKP